MTLTAPVRAPVVPADAPDLSLAHWVRRLPFPDWDMAALLFALVILLGPVVQAGGGRDRHALLLALASLVPVLVLGRVWTVGRRRILLALSPTLGAVVVCATSPMHWAGAGDIARFAYAGLLWLAVRAVVNTEPRRTAVVAALSIGGLWQFQQAYLPWWGGGDAAHAMSGTFYAPNVFGAYMAGTGFAAAALAACGPRRLGAIGWVAAPFCLAAVAFSASRATLGLSVVMITAGSLTLLFSRRYRALLRLVGVVLAAMLLALVLTSPSLMARGGGPLAGTAQKSGEATQSLAFSGGVRLEWWRAALAVGEEHPMSGAGFGAFGAAESRYQPAGQERSIYAHNVLLQGWADGGLVLVLPLAAVLMGLAWAVWPRRHRQDVGSFAALLGYGVMGAHALLDFDAQYGGCLAVAVALAAVAAAPRAEPRRNHPAARRQLSAAVGVLVAVAAAGAARADAADLDYSRGQDHGGAWTGATGPFRDARFDLVRLARGDHARGLLARTAALQEDNAAVTWERARALVATGHPEQGRRLAEGAWRERAATQPAQITGYASVLMTLSDRAGAERALVAGLRASSSRKGAEADTLSIFTAVAQIDRQLALCLTGELPSTLLSPQTERPPATCHARLLALGPAESR